MLFCETRSCNARRHNDLEGHNNFLSTLQFLYSVLGTSLLWRSTVTFFYLKVKSAKCLCLLPVVLVLSFWSWSWSWSCKQRSWSWSCYFGLGLKNLVLFTSLAITYMRIWRKLVSECSRLGEIPATVHARTDIKSGVKSGSSRFGRL